MKTMLSGHLEDATVRVSVPLSVAEARRIISLDAERRRAGKTSQKSSTGSPKTPETRLTKNNYIS